MRKIIFSLLAYSLCFAASGVNLYVSPRGSDGHSGAQAQPLATLHAALRKARELRRLHDASVKNGVRIIMEDGVYELTEAIFVRPEDGGTEDSPTIIESAPNAHPALSGGVGVSGWKKAGSVDGLPPSARGMVWVADAPTVGGQSLAFRQLWVNGKKATRAQHAPADNMPRILSWDAQKRECRIPAPKGGWSNTGQMEMLIHQRWEVAMLRVKTLLADGDKALVKFHEPESRVQFEHPWPSPVISENGNSAFVLSNAIEFLDTPGEWFLDARQGKIFYYPRQGEDMRSADVAAPVLETLVHVGGSVDRPASHVYFRGISFAHSTWMRPSRAGHVPLQAGMYMLDAYKLPTAGLPWDKDLENQAWIGRQPAAVAVSGANNIRFECCRFEHIAATALDCVTAVQHSRVERCTFDDIGGSAVVAGAFQEGNTETHIPYNPADTREICHHLYIAHNAVADAANEDWGCVGIGVGYAHDVTIEHNEVSNVSYSGICVGWGWTKQITCLKNNRIANNHVHHFAKKLFAAGGLYTLSAQPNTVICGNSIHDMTLSPYMQQPEYCYYIYLDGASSYISVYDNWCPEQKFGENNPGPGNTWRNNGPTVPDSIRRAAEKR